MTWLVSNLIESSWIDDKFKQELNIYFIFTTLQVENFFKFKSFKALQLLNIYSIYKAELVSKLEVSTEVRDEQSENIYFIFWTLDVLKFVDNFNCFKLEHKLNISPISVTCEVSNLLKSREINPLKLNILFIFFAVLSVVNEEKSKLAKFLQYENI